MQLFLRSSLRLSAPVIFLAGVLLPVKMHSSTVRSCISSRCASAGTLSPALSTSMSSGTMSSLRICRSSPPLTTRNSVFERAFISKKYSSQRVFLMISVAQNTPQRITSAHPARISPKASSAVTPCQMYSAAAASIRNVRSLMNALTGL